MNAPARRRRILIVDDCWHCTTMFDLLVKRLGHEARTAHDGAEAIEAGTEFRPDVVLMDLGLTGTDGYEVARQIRDQPWGTGVILVALTASGRGIDERRFHSSGLDHHLEKPVNFAALVRVIGSGAPA